MAPTSPHTSAPAPLDNRLIAERLEEIARLLEEQSANPFRVQAYRRAADSIRNLPRPVAELLGRQGTDGLRELPGIGESLARSIAQLSGSGELPLLDRLRGAGSGERLLATVPGIGPTFAARIRAELGIETLTDLEAAAHDGRLEQMIGMGPKRVLAVRESLAGRFRRRPPAVTKPPRSTPTADPPVAELLDVDREYRAQAKAGRLPRIAPKRFNPTGAAWLPVLHTQRDARHYTALYSNTARAHELDMTHDWVVIYRDDHDGDGQWTVTTDHFGPLAGRRVVRGREAECQEFYAHTGQKRLNL